MNVNSHALSLNICTPVQLMIVFASSRSMTEIAQKQTLAVIARNDTLLPNKHCPSQSDWEKFQS